MPVNGDEQIIYRAHDWELLPNGGVRRRSRHQQQSVGHDRPRNQRHLETRTVRTLTPVPVLDPEDHHQAYRCQAPPAPTPKPVQPRTASERLAALLRQGLSYGDAMEHLEAQEQSA